MYEINGSLFCGQYVSYNLQHTVQSYIYLRSVVKSYKSSEASY